MRRGDPDHLSCIAASRATGVMSVPCMTFSGVLPGARARRPAEKTQAFLAEEHVRGRSVCHIWVAVQGGGDQLLGRHAQPTGPGGRVGGGEGGEGGAQFGVHRLGT